MFQLAPLAIVGAIAAAAIAIPLIIHLLHRQRTQPILWGAMQFLKDSPLQQRRRKKVDHWLLMLLRMLVMAILVALLFWYQPTEKFAGLIGGAGTGGTDYAFVIDHSLSTNRRSEDSTVFQRAVATLGQVHASGKLRSADSVSIVLAEHTPREITARPQGRDDLPRVLDDLRKLKPGLTDGEIPKAIQTARKQVAQGRNSRKVIFVLSDAQQAAWKVKDQSAWTAAVGEVGPNAPPAVEVYDIPITFDQQAANVTVMSLTIAPVLIGTARPATIEATLSSNGSKETASAPAILKVNGKEVARQQVPSIAPGESRTIRFEHTFVDPHSNWIEVRVDTSDAQSEDNAAFASAYAWESLPVLVIDSAISNLQPDATNQAASFETFKGSAFLRHAMLSDAANPDAPPLVKPTVVSFAYKGLEKLKLEDYACVVVNDVPLLPAAFAERLEDYVDAGHGVWFILGKNTDRAFIEKTLPDAQLFAANIRSNQSAVEKAPSLDVKDPVIMSDFTARESNPLGGMNTYKWWAIEPTSAGAKTILETATGDPLVVMREMGSNGGRVFVWTTPVDRASAWNNWPANPSFPPLVNVMVYHLSNGWTQGMKNGGLNTGDPLKWTGVTNPPVQKAYITHPDGTKKEWRPQLRDGRQVISYGETHQPGRYEMRFDQTLLPPMYYGVSVNPIELDQKVLTDEDRQWLSHADHRYVKQRIERDGLVSALGGAGEAESQVWKFIAVILLLVLLGETYMTYRMVNRQTGPGIQTGALAGRVARA